MMVTGAVSWHSVALSTGHKSIGLIIVVGRPGLSVVTV